MSKGSLTGLSVNKHMFIPKAGVAALLVLHRLPR